MTSLLAFYQQHGISPVHQDIRDLDAHYARRAFLYRSLGLPPFAFRGKDILDIGPGTGENSRYLYALHPRTLALVEPNPIAAAELRLHRWLVIEDRIEQLEPVERYDIVLCEGLLGLSGTDSFALLEACARHVKIGGVLVLTCIDAISDHAEVIRRAHAQQIIDRTATLAEQVAQLRPIFAPHLATLAGMTRSVDDWILDNLLNPASIGPTFSIPDALTALDGRFDLLGCSPRFLQDWRWYKHGGSGTAWALESYWQHAHNLLDYRAVHGPQSEATNRALMANCLAYREHLRAFEAGERDAPDATLTDIGWFGRGQQYLSFVRV